MRYSLTKEKKDLQPEICYMDMFFRKKRKKIGFIIAKKYILWYNANVEDLAFLQLMILSNNFKEIYQ